MTKPTFAQRIKQQKPILADGGMGTMLLQRTRVSLHSCFDELNLTDPETVRGIHADYIKAGAELIETNSFGANPLKLAEFDLQERAIEINQTAVQLVRDAMVASGRDDVYIAGAVGPIGTRLKPYGQVTKEQAKDAFRVQIQALIDSAVDLLLFETFADHKELLLAVEAARELTQDLVIVAQATFSVDQTTYTGHNPARVASDLYKAGVNVIGVNCGSGPANVAQILHIMHDAVPEATFSAMPNAGYPEMVGGRAIYPAQADYLGDYALTFQSIGATIIGGCCGTTPEHIAAMRRALDTPAPVQPAIHVADVDNEDDDHAHQPPTYLAERLANGQFTINVEMTPPRSFTADKLLAKARLLRDAGADLIDVADTPAAKMKMSAWAVSHLLQDRVGMETVLHFPTRGRNILRVQGDLLAAHALGLRNLFVTMGDPTRIGDYPEAMDGYDIVPSKLIDLIKHEMNAGRDMAGNSIGMPTHFTVGCALNMGADDLDRELKVLDKKLESGADFALGQAVFDPPRIEKFLKRYRELRGEDFKLPVLMGVMPLYSVRHALFLHNEVPGIVIPDAIFKRLQDAGDDAPQEGVTIAKELMRHMRPYVQGAYIIPSFGRYELAAEVVDDVAHAPVSL